MDVLHRPNIKAPGGLGGDHNRGSSGEFSGQHHLLQVSAGKAAGHGIPTGGHDAVCPYQVFTKLMDFFEVHHPESLKLRPRMVFKNQVFLYGKIHHQPCVNSVLRYSSHFRFDGRCRASRS